MTLTELRYITAVAKERHFGRAAQACFVSQPTLSVAVKKLEEELGIAIFERHQHDVLLTETGKKIIEQARFVLEQAEIIKTIANRVDGALKGDLKLGVIYTVGPYLIPKLLPQIQKLAPDLTLIIEEDYTDNLLIKLKEGDVDMIIVSTPFDHAAIDTEFLYKESFMAVLPKKHEMSKKKTVNMSDLMDDVLLLLRSGNCFRDQVINACANCRDARLSSNTIQKTLESSSIETIRQMVAGGAGITILPATATEHSYDMDDLIVYKPISAPAPEREVILAWRSSYPGEAVAKVVKEAVCSSGINCVDSD